MLLLGTLLLVGCGDGRSSTTPTEAKSARAALAPDVDLADVIDALFLGSGPMVARDGVTACATSRRVWTGFPRGTVLRVRVSSAVPVDAQRALRLVLPQVALATGGSVRAVLEPTPEEDPRPGDAEVSVAAAGAAADGCRGTAGCVQFGFAERGVLRWVRVVEADGQGTGDYVRDVLGRGIMGLCRISARRLAGSGGSLMAAEPDGAGSQPGLTPADVEAARAVYGSALEPGAARKDFIRVGLVPARTGQ